MKVERRSMKKSGSPKNSKRRRRNKSSSLILPPSSLVSPPSSFRLHPSSLVAIVMGSKSDWETMRAASETLENFDVPHESRVMSAHRTPALAAEFASTAESRGIEVIIAAAGGAAHLAGVIAAHTTLPVLGVPMKSEALNGMDSLLSTDQMPAGIPVATFAIGEAGAANAALFVVALLARGDAKLAKKLANFRASQTATMRGKTLPPQKRK